VGHPDEEQNKRVESQLIDLDDDDEFNNEYHGSVSPMTLEDTVPFQRPSWNQPPHLVLFFSRSHQHRLIEG
jgi:hypothetical protein